MRRFISLPLLLFLLSWTKSFAVLPPRYGQELHVSLPLIYWSLDPHRIVLTPERPLLDLLYPALTYIAPHGAIVPELAENWSSEDGGREWTLDLRQQIFFSNGSPIQLDDVERAFTAGFRAVGLPGPTVRKEPPRTIKLFFSSPQPLLPELLSYPAFSLTRHHEKTTLGAGPFFPDDSLNVDRLTLLPNRFAQEGRPFIDRLVLHFGSSPTPALLFKLEQVQLSYVAPGQLNAVLNDPSLEINLLLLSRYRSYALLVNTHRIPLELRQFLHAMIPYDAILEEVLFSFGRPARAVFHGLTERHPVEILATPPHLDEPVKLLYHAALPLAEQLAHTLEVVFSTLGMEVQREAAIPSELEQQLHNGNYTFYLHPYAPQFVSLPLNAFFFLKETNLGPKELSLDSAVEQLEKLTDDHTLIPLFHTDALFLQKQRLINLPVGHLNQFRFERTWLRNR